MIALQKKWKLCLLMIWLGISTVNSPCGAEVIPVPKGWEAPLSGYFMTPEDARKVGIALEERRLKMWGWESAYSDLRTEFVTSADDFKGQLKALEGQINGERKAWKAEAARNRANNIFWLPAAGFAGYAAGR